MSSGKDALMRGDVISRQEVADKADAGVFSDAERDAVYRVMRERRDVRGEFLPDAVPDDVSKRPMPHLRSACRSHGISSSSATPACARPCTMPLQGPMPRPPTCSLA
jgi:hypothetical protein